MRICFIHPDLGIGGAERLVVDAALGLQRLGHTVDIITSHYDTERCFQETKNGDTLFPVAVGGRFKLICAIFRQVHLVFALWLSKSASYDVFFVDQLSACLPLLRLLTNTPAVFYCHFPDLLLSPNRDQRGTSGILRSLYRLPLDLLEEQSTRAADAILVNSNFTATVFKDTFKHITLQPEVVYPGIDTTAFSSDQHTFDADLAKVIGESQYFLSLNRFERKKDVALAIRAFSRVKQADSTRNLKLLIAGGFDERMKDCVDTLRQLEQLAQSLHLSHSRLEEEGASESSIIFVPNVSTERKLALLSSKQAVALLYTPQNEHFGIVPVESMASGLPVIACDSGGPTESIVDDGISSRKTTGFLKAPDETEWSETMLELLQISSEKRQHLATAGKKRAAEKFSVSSMAKQLDSTLSQVATESRTSRNQRHLGLTLTLLVLAVITLVCALKFQRE